MWQALLLANNFFGMKGASELSGLLDVTKNSEVRPLRCASQKPIPPRPAPLGAVAPLGDAICGAPVRSQGMAWTPRGLSVAHLPCGSLTLQVIIEEIDVSNNFFGENGGTMFLTMLGQNSVLRRASVPILSCERRGSSLLAGRYMCRLCVSAVTGYRWRYGGSRLTHMDGAIGRQDSKMQLAPRPALLAQP